MREEFMRQAIALSLQNVRAGGGPFGAVVVRGAEVVGRGTNCVTTNNDPTAHAEIVAIRAACETLHVFHLNDCEIYTSCEPCPMCLAAMYWAGVRGYYYGNTRIEAARVGFDDALIYDEMGKAPQDRLVPGSRLLADEAIAAFHEWERSPLKIRY